MEDTSQELNRPLLETMRSRSFKDWGEAPKYNKEYRLLRWPASRPPEQPYRNTETGHLIRTVTPMWLSNLRFERNSKARGFWNFRRAGGGWGGSKPDSVRVLMRDLCSCMSLNIPFKTPTYKYDPKTTTLYVGEKGQIRYSLETGRISSFTYGGIYDRRMSLMLRRFSIYVIKKRKKLIYIKDIVQDELEIGLDEVIPVPLYDPYPGNEVSELSYVQGCCPTIVNPFLNREFFASRNEQVQSRSRSRPASPYRNPELIREQPPLTIQIPVNTGQVRTLTLPPNIRWDRIEPLTTTVAPPSIVDVLVNNPVQHIAQLNTTTIDLRDSHVFTHVVQDPS